MDTKPSEQIKALGLELPPAPPPAGLYKPVLVSNGYLYVSGQGPMQTNGTLLKGRAGDDLDLEQAKLAARQVGLTMLATIYSVSCPIGLSRTHSSQHCGNAQDSW